MAIEIPGLAADRLPHPDWSPAAALSRFSLAAGPLLAALESSGAPASVLQALRDVTPGTPIDVLVGSDRGLVQVLAEGRRLNLTGPARDAVLELIGDAGAAMPLRAPVPAPGLPDAFLAARVAAVQAQVQEARAHVTDAQPQLEDAPHPDPVVVLPAPLMQSPDAAAAGRALAGAVDASGLFLEAHVAQWLRGQRTLAQIQDEVRAMPAPAQSATATAQASRADAQIDALEQQVVRLQAQAWPGQPLQLEIRRDAQRRGTAAPEDVAAGVCQATLSLHLPRLGSLQARIRVLHETVGLQITAEDMARVAAHLEDLAGAFSARGFNVATVELSAAPSRGPASVA